MWKHPFTSKNAVPCYDGMCHACGKKGHYRHVCATPKSVHEVQEEDSSLFLGTIADPWMVVLDQKVKFNLDTGAAVTVIPV